MSPLTATDERAFLDWGDPVPGISFPGHTLGALVRATLRRRPGLQAPA